MSRGTPQQYAAADPQSSVWVGASAGTGKTKVLTDRVLRLLLAGVSPERILCITFTKAGAMEMSARIGALLARWAILDDIALAEEVADLCDIPPFEADVAAARKLFARVLDTPEALHIETIHAFCQSVLRRFPLEAGISPHFEILDELSAKKNLEKAQRDMIARIRSGEGDPAVEKGLQAVSHFTNENDFAGILKTLLSERTRLADTRQRLGGLGPMCHHMARELGLNPGTTPEHVRTALCTTGHDSALRAAAAVLCECGTPNDRTRGQNILAFLDAPNRTPVLDSYMKIFLTQEGPPRQRLATNACADARPALEEEGLRLEQGRQTLLAAQCLEASTGLLHLADEILADYAHTKKTRALLDYDDLILATRQLMTRSDSADWILYKLDGGFDHILVDEAQDTNPDQWEVIRNLAAEYFAGQGASDRNRTLFVVGDIKQSIFSFQKADPAGFSRMRGYFRTLATGADKAWREIPLADSFRSTSAVLAAVDAVFAQEDAARGLGEEAIHHTSRRNGQAGSVELWPLITHDDEADPQNLLPSPTTQLATRIADTIRNWLDTGALLPARGRPVMPRDILILVRQRGPLFQNMIRALRNRKIPVAGADRMILGEQLAVVDVLALIEALLLPENDLALACALKTPPIGLSEDTLFALSHDRRSASLWERLGTSRAPDAIKARQWLETLRGKTDFIPPYELLEHILSAPCPADPHGSGRRAFLQRLGSESTDALDELLQKALEFERLNPPSLQGFSLWMASGSSEIKRDMDEGRLDEVRIMTVHGSKGLQAPIVFLPDTTSQPKFDAKLIWSDTGLPFWIPSTLRSITSLGPRLADLRTRQEEEYRRLLYVAMTRAADRLIVCGAARKDAPAGCWHTLVSNGLRAVLPAAATLAQGQDILSLETPQTAPVRREPPPSPEAGTDNSLPEWLHRMAPEEPRPSRPLAPSRPSGDEPPCLSPLDANADDPRRFQRGTLIHKLLQTLPDLPKDARTATGRAFLASPAHDLSPEKAENMLQEVLALLDHPDFHFLFGPGSMAEVPISGQVSDHTVISGQIDRLAITKDTVYLVDYKTNRPPARDAAEIPEAYLRQMAAYRAALQRIHPEKRILCALLWTSRCDLMQIPDHLLDHHAP